MAQKKISNINDEFDPALLLVIARRNQLWVALVLVVCAAAALIYNRYTHPVFEASSVVQLNTSSTTAELMQYDPKIFENDLAQEIELMRSSVFLGRVVNKLDLKISYFRQGNVLSFEQYRNAPYRVEVAGVREQIYDVPCYMKFKNQKEVTITYETSQQRYAKTIPTGVWTKVPLIDSIRINVINYKEIKDEAEFLKEENLFFQINNPENIVSNITRNLEITMMNEAAKTIQIKYKDRNAGKAADVANYIAKEFLIFDVEKKSESANQTLAFLDTTINRMYDNLAKSEDELTNFRISNKIIDEKIAKNSLENGGYLGKIDQLETQRVEAEFEIRTLQSVENELVKNPKDVYGLVALTAAIDANSVINRLLEDLQNLLLKRVDLRIDLQEESTELKVLDAKINSQRKLIIASIAAVRDALETRRDELTRKINEYDAMVLNQALGYDAIEYSRLQRQNQINEKYYNQLVIQKAELTVLKAGYVPQNLILDFAREPKKPIYPDKKVIMLSGILTWLIISFAIIVFRYLMHNQISNIGDIIKITKTPVLGFIPKFSEEIPVSQLIVDKKPKSLISEAFRSVRSNLEFISHTPGPKVIAITSTISGEGKTFVCINLGGIIAFSEKRVILLDLDMRKPKIHQGFEAPNEKGMSTILIGKDEIDECIQHSNLKNLDFITAGPIPPNPSELILSQKMEDIIIYLKTKYDVIVVDNPPVGLVTDGIRLIAMADYPIYILKSNYSKKNFILNVEKLLNENNVKNLSIILNSVENNRNSYGYGYSYGYNYGYGYGYGYGYLYGFGYYDEDKGAEKKKEPFFKRILKKIIPS